MNKARVSSVNKLIYKYCEIGTFGLKKDVFFKSSLSSGRVKRCTRYHNSASVDAPIASTLTRSLCYQETEDFQKIHFTFSEKEVEFDSSSFVLN